MQIISCFIRISFYVVILSIFKDISSLDTEGAIKAGKQRSATRVNTIVKTLEAAESSLKELAAFSPN